MEVQHFSELAECAVRYALGRMTYVSYSVPAAITANMEFVSTRALHNIVRDIDEYKIGYGHIGMECDEESWMKLKACCQSAIKEREKTNGSN